MAQFVGLLSTGKGSWSDVATLMNKDEFDEVFIITNLFGKDKFTNLPDKKVEIFTVDFNKDAKALAKDMVSALRGNMKFGDVAVNISSGNGKEHMALISALLNVGVGLRFVTVDNNKKLQELSPHVDYETGNML